MAPQVAVRADEVVAWPAGRVCPLGRLREAWVVARYGPAMAARSGAAAAGPMRPGLPALVGRAIALYEAHAERRPDGWPAGGAAALCVLGEQGRAQRFAGDIARLLGLAKGMRAAARLHDETRLRAAQARAETRRTPPPAGFRLAFRTGRVRVETAEQRRCR